jgi:hypothetical protein
MANGTSVEAGQPVEYLAQVRWLLRHREYRRAVEAIDRRWAYLADDASPIPVEDVRTYAYERLVSLGPGQSGRAPVSLRRGSQVSLRRSVLVDLRRLDRPALERVLRWVLGPELRAAEEALRAGDYAATVTAAEAAARIDDRSTRIALAHARALHELAVDALNGEAPDFDDVLGKLQRATRLANRVGADPALRDSHKKLSAALDEVVAVAKRRRDRTARVEAVRSVVRRFNRLVQHYNERDQVASHVQLGNARASLAQIRGEVERLSRQHEAGSPAGQVLADLLLKCVQYRDHLERLARHVPGD